MRQWGGLPAGIPSFPTSAYKSFGERITGVSTKTLSPWDEQGWQTERDGESAGWPRHRGFGFVVEEGRDSAGQRCWLTASRGDSKESATENRPPMARSGGHRQG